MALVLAHLQTFGTTYLSPALTSTGKTVLVFGKENLVPALSEAGKSVGTFVSPALNQTGEWVSKNPGSSLIYAGSALTLFAPGVLSVPIFWVLGFGGVGPAAGSIAATVQAGNGLVRAGGVFATVQSAAMGGYGAGFVASAVRGGVVGLGMFTGLFGSRNATVAR